jgi:D-3-phosphoglycerate dehydrogenase / 2-oxoglutarate reductase
VLVTPRSFGVDAPELRGELERSVGEVRYNTAGRSLKSAELRQQMVDVDGLLAGLDEIDEAVFLASPCLRVVARYGVGISNVDLRAARERHVVVTNTPGANSEAVAELTIGLMFALARSIPQSSRTVRSGAWTSTTGVEISGRTLGLIGLGRIGQSVAGRALALGCRVMAYDPYITQSRLSNTRIELAGLESVVASSDFLSLHLPLTDETSDMVDRAFLEWVRPGAYFINTARGELVVEADLLWALESGRIRAAALDTLVQEPPDPAHPLIHHHNVIVTPHIGAHTAEATTAMGRDALQDLLAVLSGAAAANPVVSKGETQYANL